MAILIVKFCFHGYRYNKKMLLFSLVFLVSSLMLTKQFGCVGFVLANCLNMSTRIAYR